MQYQEGWFTKWTLEVPLLIYNNKDHLRKWKPSTRRKTPYKKNHIAIPVFEPGTNTKTFDKEKEIWWNVDFKISFH